MKTLILFAIAFVSTNLVQADLDAILEPLPEPAPQRDEAATPQEIGPVEAIAAKKSRVEVELSKEEPEEIEAVFEPITREDLHGRIEQLIQEKFRPSGNLTLVALRDLPNLSDYSHPFNVVMLSLPLRLNENNMHLSFQVENEKGVIGEWSIPFRPHLFSSVWFINAHLRRGELPSNSDFIVREVDMLQNPDAVLAYPETLLRHEYSRDLRPGKPLVWGDLQDRSLVKKGDVVEVVAAKGLLAVTMKAIARQDGTEGDIVMLKNLDSHREFAARVVGINKAEVSF